MGELQKKEEEMRQMFVQRVKEKEAELKEAEKEVRHTEILHASLVFVSGQVSANLVKCFIFIATQLHEKFDRLKKLHQDEKKKLEEKKKSLDDELNMFKQKKTAAELLQNQAQQAGGSTTLKRDKEKKKWVLIFSFSFLFCLQFWKVWKLLAMVNLGTARPQNISPKYVVFLSIPCALCTTFM